MLIIIHTKEIKESFEIEASNLLQVIDYLKNNKVELWENLKDTKLSYTLGDLSNTIRPIPIYPTGIAMNFSTYNILLIGSLVELAEGFSISAIAASVASYASSASFAAAGGVAGGAAAATAATVASTVAYALTYVALSMAVSLAIGAIIQALSPTSTVSGDPSTQSNRIFNGVPNIKEQGGSVPIVLGKCIFGGVVIAADMYSVSTGLTGTSVAVGDVGETPLINVPATSNWYRVG